MRIALIGAYGQLGTDLRQVLSDEVIPLSHQQIELADEARVRTCLDAIQPDLVINAAAYNLVDRAEDEPQLAYDINALGPRRLAAYCEARQRTLLHVSTDYVFGSERSRTLPYVETDQTGPLGAYAVSKLAGEYFVQAMCQRHYIIRTCGLFGVAARAGAGKGNFIETMLRLGRERPELRVVNDQHCTPTSSADLAAAIGKLIQTTAYGLYHATNSGSTTWHELAQTALQLRGLSTPVIPIPSSDYPTKAARPRFSVLNCQKLSQVIGQSLPPWQEAVERYLKN